MNHTVRGMHSQAVEVLGERIVSGAYPPGELLYPELIEAELGVSKTVVREAMRVLAAKGLIDSRQKRGTVVRPRADWSLLDGDLLRWQGLGVPDPGFLDNLAEVRAIVEPAAARLAAARRDEDDLAAMASAIDRMRAAVGLGDIVEADLAFHRALLAAAHNELLTRMEVVIEAGLRVRDQHVHGAEHGAEHAADPVPAHAAVLSAIDERNQDAADQAVRALLVQADTDLHKILTRSRPEPE